LEKTTEFGQVFTILHDKVKIFKIFCRKGRELDMGEMLE